MFKKHQKQPNLDHFGKSVNTQLTCRILPQISQKMWISPKNIFLQNFESIFLIEFLGGQKKHEKTTIFKVFVMYFSVLCVVNKRRIPRKHITGLGPDHRINLFF